MWKITVIFSIDLVRLLHPTGIGIELSEKFENLNIWLSKYRKNLNSRPTRSEETPGWHHAPNYHRFPDIRH